MLKSALSKLKRACCLPTASSFLRGNGPKRPDPVTVFRKEQKSTKSGTDKDKECEKCRALIELIFGPTKPTEVIKGNQKTEIPETLLYQSHDLKKNEAVPTETPIVGLNSSVITAKEDNMLITDETNKIETENALRHATTAKQTEEQLAQKFEVIDKPYMVEEERPNIERYNGPPNVIGNIAETNSSFNYEDRKFSYFTDTKDHQNKPGGSAETDRYDEIAKRCLDAPRNQIDERLLKKLGKLGVPQTSPREESVIEENIIQMDVLRKPRRPKPVEKNEIELETRKFERDPPIAYIDNLPPAIQRTDNAKASTDDDIGISTLKTERIQLYEIDKKPLMYSEEITAKEENNSLECEKNKDLTKPDPSYDFSQVIIDPYDKRNIAHEKDEEEEYDPYWFNKFSFYHNQTMSATTANVSEIGPNTSLNEPLNYERPKEKSNENEPPISSEIAIKRSEAIDFKQEISSHAPQTSETQTYLTQFEKKSNMYNYADESIQYSNLPNPVTNPESRKNINEVYTITPETTIKREGDVTDIALPKPETSSHAPQTSETQYFTQFEKNSNMYNYNYADESIQYSNPPNPVTNPESRKNINDVYTITPETTIKREVEATDIALPKPETSSHAPQTSETQYLTQFENKSNIDDYTNESKQCLTPSSPVTNAESSKNISDANPSFTQTETQQNSETQHVAAVQNAYSTNPNVDPNLPIEQISHSFMQPQTMVNPLANSETQTEPAKDESNVVANCSLLRQAQKELPLSELLKRVRMRNHMEFCQAFDRQLDPVEGKCGKKTPPCPPPAPKCPPPSPPPCPPAPPPCPKPCKPACPPPCPPPCPAPCPPAKKSPCEKFKNIYSDYIFKNIITIISQPEVSFQPKAPVPSEVVSEPIDLGFWMIVAPKKVSVNLGSNIDAETLTFARDFEPWVPIPSWPIPIKEKKRPLVCPKEGCKLIPPPRLNPPCKENPCINFPKRINSFSTVNFFTYFLMSDFKDV